MHEAPTIFSSRSQQVTIAALNTENHPASTITSNSSQHNDTSKRNWDAYSRSWSASDVLQLRTLDRYLGMEALRARIFQLDKAWRL